jgi:hypothetical protein
VIEPVADANEVRRVDRVYSESLLEHKIPYLLKCGVFCPDCFAAGRLTSGSGGRSRAEV